jgi:hypothetical protein
MPTDQQTTQQDSHRQFLKISTAIAAGVSTTCYLANICIRLGSAFQWEPQVEQIVGDDDARRDQRRGFEIVV